MTTLTERLVTVGLGEVKSATAPEAVLMALGLGSCIAVAMYDPQMRIGGLAHVVLPRAPEAHPAPSAKFAEIAVPVLVDQMVAHGADPRRLVCKITGGARVLATGPMHDNFRIGERNLEAVVAALRKAGIRPRASDCGGSTGRSFRLVVSDGVMTVKRLGKDWQEL